MVSALLFSVHVTHKQLGGINDRDNWMSLAFILKVMSQSSYVQLFSLVVSFLWCSHPKNLFSLTIRQNDNIEIDCIAQIISFQPQFTELNLKRNCTLPVKTLTEDDLCFPALRRSCFSDLLVTFRVQLEFLKNQLEAISSQVSSNATGFSPRLSPCQAVISTFKSFSH